MKSGCKSHTHSYSNYIHFLTFSKNIKQNDFMRHTQHHYKHTIIFLTHHPTHPPGALHHLPLSKSRQVTRQSKWRLSNVTTFSCLVRIHTADLWNLSSNETGTGIVAHAGDECVREKKERCERLWWMERGRWRVWEFTWCRENLWYEWNLMKRTFCL